MYENYFKIIDSGNYGDDELYCVVKELLLIYSGVIEDSLFEFNSNQIHMIVINSSKYCEKRDYSNLNSEKMKILDKDLNSIKFLPSKPRLMFSL